MNAVQNNVYVNGDYLSKNPTWGREDSTWKAKAVDALIKKNNLHPDSIAEIGCGFGEILAHLSKLNESIKSFSGYDISPHAIAEAKKNETDRVKFYNADFTEVTSTFADLLLVIDVIEHIPDYLSFLNKLRKKGNEFIFHIPLDLSVRTIFKSHVLFQQRSDVGHLHYFSRQHVEWTLKDCGFKIKDWQYTFSESDRKKAGTLKQKIKKILRRISFFVARETSVKLWGGYSVMIYCQKHG